MLAISFIIKEILWKREELFDFSHRYIILGMQSPQPALPNAKHENSSYKSCHESERAFSILASFFSEGENLISYDFLVSIRKVGSFFFFLFKKSCHSNNYSSQGISLSTDNAAY